MAHISEKYDITAIALAAKAASSVTAVLPESRLNAALEAMANALIDNADAIIAVNVKDVEAARAAGMTVMLDRLMLNEARIEGIANGIRKVAALPTPVGSGSFTRRPNGLVIERLRVPLGLVGVIYESRPNVTSDVAALCLKTGNACLLRGGKEAFSSNSVIISILREAIEKEGVPADAISFVSDTSREIAAEMMKLHGIIDVLIPRGGADLINTVVEQSNIPVIETGAGNCHVYAHSDCDFDMALSIIKNAKCSRPSVCNAAETLLIHRDIAKKLLPLVKDTLDNIELRGCDETAKIIDVIAEDNWYTEYNDYILAIKIVGSLDEAIEHINKYSTKHSDCIITRDMTAARRFAEGVDSAAVYINASTRYTDGEEFGLGAEIGISTAKLHARGPMGLDALTCEKFVITGNGHIR
ncbi:MAG: glutamate-5-semialdehyde dehydrogenase [Oscillospiraceae bacterium]|nr:glutamate-5-semialdehyde dehydrogenase [Oscillospiraceae bacterium]